MSKIKEFIDNLEDLNIPNDNVTNTIDVSYVDWNGEDNWKSIIKLLNTLDNGVYNAKDTDDNLVIISKTKNNIRRATWKGKVATIHDYYYDEDGITVSETFEYDN